MDVQYGLWRSLRPCGRRRIIVLLDPASEGVLTTDRTKKSIPLTGRAVLFIGPKTNLCLKQDAAVVCLGLPDDFMMDAAPGFSWNQPLVKSWAAMMKSNFEIGTFAGVFLRLCRDEETLSACSIQGLGTVLAELILRTQLKKSVRTAKGDALTEAQLQKALAYYAAHFKDEFDYEALAAAAGYCRDHFGKLFKRTVGMCPRDFLMFWRVRYAQQLRRAGQRATDASYEAGFPEQNYFGYWVRVFSGISPKKSRPVSSKSRQFTSEVLKKASQYVHAFGLEAA